MRKDPSTVTGLKFAKVLSWLVYAYFVLAVIILVLEFFLLLFNASPDASFTEWVYRSADRVLEPFRGIFPSHTVDNGSVIDFAVLFAIIMYGILAMVLNAVVAFFDRKIHEERRKAWLAAQELEQAPPRPA
jgi:uncharacterized protein YggT (Ycf19 family)